MDAFDARCSCGRRRWRRLAWLTEILMLVRCRGCASIRVMEVE